MEVSNYPPNKLDSSFYKSYNMGVNINKMEERCYKVHWQGEKIAYIPEILNRKYNNRKLENNQ